MLAWGFSSMATQPVFFVPWPCRIRCQVYFVPEFLPAMCYVVGQCSVWFKLWLSIHGNVGVKLVNWTRDDSGAGPKIRHAS
jgi:hypothetical protein